MPRHFITCRYMCFIIQKHNSVLCGSSSCAWESLRLLNRHARYESTSTLTPRKEVSFKDPPTSPSSCQTFPSSILPPLVPGHFVHTSVCYDIHVINSESAKRFGLIDTNDERGLQGNIAVGRRVNVLCVSHRAL